VVRDESIDLVAIQLVTTAATPTKVTPTMVALTPVVAADGEQWVHPKNIES